MGLFRRRPKPDAGNGKAGEPDLLAARTVHERIEVTVERVWVSMVVRNSQAASTAEGAGAEAGPGGPAEIEGKAVKSLESPNEELPKRLKGL